METILSLLIQENNNTAFTGFFLVGFQSSQDVRLFLFLLLLVAFCGTICGNLLIITLVSTSKNLHTPMYFFISQLSINDILLTTDIVPNTLHILLNNGGGFISYSSCMTQFCFFIISEASECFLLTAMSYDRYVAICNPLHYTSIMTNIYCVKLAAISWFFGFLVTLIYGLTVLMLGYCEQNVIDHYYCDLAPLIEIACSDTEAIKLEIYILSFPVLFIPITIVIISYIQIIATILSFQTSISRQKAFSTCSSHLTVVSIFYITPLSVYVFPTRGINSNLSKLLSLLYTVFTPFINPIIYSLRNKDINKPLQEIICATKTSLLNVFVKKPV